MIFCRQCGTQLNDGAIFCKKCGTKINGDKEEGKNTQNLDGYSSEYQGGNYNYQFERNKSQQLLEETKGRGKAIWENLRSKGTELLSKLKETVGKIVEKSKNDKKFATKLKIGATAVVVAVMGLTIISTMDKRVAVDECVVVNVEGYNTLGYVYSCSIDENAFTKKVLGSDSQELDAEEISKVYALVRGINLSADNETNLSNGDEIVVNISYDNEIAHEYGIKLTGDTYTFKVSGLEELQDYNLFEDLEVYFSGVEPNVKVYYEVNNDMIDYSLFTVDKTDGLKNGDIVTITYIGSETDLAWYGYRITKLSEQYTCEGVATYVTKATDLEDSIFDKMKNDAKDCIETYFANNYEEISCENLSYCGNYVLTGKHDSDGNIVYIIYSGQVASKEQIEVWNEDLGIYEYISSFETQTVYFPIGFNDVIVNTDKTVVYDLISSTICGTTDLDSGWSNVKGYTNGAMMFNDLIQKQKVDYSFDVSESLSQFGDFTTSLESEINVAEGDYILPTSNSAYITESDLDGFTKEKLRLALNELYARYGYIFADEELKAYFESKSWYQGTIENGSFDESVFNEYETKNKDTIVQYMESKGYR